MLVQCAKQHRSTDAELLLQQRLTIFATNCAVLSTMALMSGGGKITPIAFV